MIYDFLGVAGGQAGNFKAASPITYVDKADAPMLHYQGTVDGSCPTTRPT